MNLNNKTQIIESSNYARFFSFLSLSLFLLTLLSSLLLSSPIVLADDTASDTIRINVPLTCTLSLSETTAHTATVNAGTYVNNIGESNVKATCNDSEGFAIYAIGYSGDTYGNNTLINTENSNYTIATGTATSGATSNWAMKLTSTAGTYEPIIVGSTGDSEKEQNTPDFSNYTSIPSTYTKVVYRNSATDQSTGANFKTTYAAYVNSTQFTGIYEGKVKYTLVHPASETPLQPQTATSGCINYFANASDAVGTMGCQSATDDASLDLLASNFSRTGYGFAGWSDKFDYATNQNAKFYGPMETITVPTGTTANGLSLYAVWVKSQGSIQDQSKVASVCSELDTAPTDGTANLSSVSALTDQRDNNTYAIARLADGKCWMIENLRLESRDTVGDNRFDSSITNESLAQGYGTSATYGNFGGLADAENTNFSDSTTADSLTTANSLYYSGTQSGTATINIGTTIYPAYRMPRYNNLNTQSRAQNSPNTNSFSNNNTNGGMYSYGNYYTWHAAIADTTYNGSNNNSSDTTSICPKGWRLPHGGQTTVNTTAEFYLLGKAIMNNIEPDQNASNGYGSYGNSVTNTADKTATAAFRSYPNNFLYSGYFDMSSASSRGSHGYYWSSTAYGSCHSYILSLYSSHVSPGTDVYVKYGGRSIRCLAL